MAGRRHGGSQYLAGLLDRYGDALHYDFAVRGYRLADLVFGEGAWTPTELLAFIRWLPDTSAFAASQAHEASRLPDTVRPAARSDDPTRFLGWGRDRLLLAEIADQAQAGAIATVAVNTDKKNASRVPKFRPTPTPWTDAAKPGLFERLAKRSKTTR